MRIVNVRLIFEPMLLAAALHVSVVAQQAPPVKVTISTPTPVVDSGDPIRIDVSVLNTSDQTIEIWKALGPDGQAEFVNSVQAYDAWGKPLAWIAGRHNALSRKPIEVEPGKSLDDFLILTNLYDLSKPGTYTVFVRHEFIRPGAEPLKDRMLLVPSNRLSVTVEE
jgi:hypothetical protein